VCGSKLVIREVGLWSRLGGEATQAVDQADESGRVAEPDRREGWID